MDDDNHDEGSSYFPSFRVWLCGTFRMERRVESGYELVRTSEWGGSSYPRLLLKALLCCPGRQARRDALLEMLWPDAELEQAVQYLNTATTKLRKVLAPSKGEASLLLTDEDSRVSRLAEQSLLWVDVDAALTLLGEAERRGRTSPEALSLLEEAETYLSKGTILQEEEGHWAAGRRATVEQARYRTRLWLAEAYEQQQMPGQATTVLSHLLEEDQTDEDVLCRLMLLLHRQGMTQQALRVYERSCEVAAREEVELTEATSKLAAQLAASDRRISTGGFLTSPSASTLLPGQQHDPLAATEPFLSSPLLPPTGSEQGVFFSPITSMTLSTTHGAQTDWSVWFGLKLGQIVTLVDNWQELALYSDRLQTILDQEIVVLDAMKSDGSNENYLLSRRQMLITIATLPVALSTSLQTGIISTVMIEKLLVRCAASLTACWHLLKGSELSLIEQTLSTYLLSLVTLAQQPSRYQKTAARLASQAYRLYGIVALHRNNLQARENYCQQALYFGEITQNPSVLVSAQISLASTYYYNKKPLHAANTYQEALVYQDAIPPLQRSRLHVELAVVYAQQKLEQDALHALDLARQLYPQHPENDPSFLYAEFSPASMILEEGLTYLALAQHFPDRDYKLDAWKSFAQIDKLRLKSTVPERIFFEITNHQAATALLLQELGLVKHYLEKGIGGAQRLQSKQRRQEASDIYQQALSAWPHEKSLKELQDLFHASNH